MRDRAREMFDRALLECSIPHAFSRHVTHDDGQLRIGDHTYDLEGFERVLVVSMGKAGHTMAETLTNIVGSGLSGIIDCPNMPPAQLFGFRYFIGGHPLPNEESMRAGDAILRLVAGLSAQTLALFLISGGASAIAEKPISAEISLADVVETYKALVHSGAPIAEINAVRKHLSALKGGRLARAAAPAQQVSILVSDVPENSLDALASGPTMPDTTTVADCEAIRKRYNLPPHFPASVRTLFEPTCWRRRQSKAIQLLSALATSRCCRMRPQPTRRLRVLRRAALPSSWMTVATIGTISVPLTICSPGCASCAKECRGRA